MPDFGIFRGFNEKLFGDKLYAGQLPINLGLIGSESFTSQLLELYPNAAAAYSLRPLRSAYTGSAIRVRRSSDNTEQDIGFDLSGALDTTALLTFTGTGALDNGFVTKWYDQSGNGRDATQTTSANQPQIVNSGSVILINAKPTINFNGILNSLSASSLNLSNLDKMDVFQTLSFNTYLASKASFGLTDGLRDPGGNSFLTLYPANTISGNGVRGFFNGNIILDENGATRTGQILFNFEKTLSNSQKFFVNGTQINIDTQTKILQTGSNLYIGTNDLDQTFAGTIQETIFYTSDQSSNRTGIETNINDFYSIY
jgi:hypothetical protein